jgi:hypothetical protein
MFQGGDHAGFESPFGHPQIAQQAIRDIGQRAVGIELAVVKGTLEYPGSGLALHCDQAGTINGAGRYVHVVRRQGFAEQQADTLHRITTDYSNS